MRKLLTSPLRENWNLLNEDLSAFQTKRRLTFRRFIKLSNSLHKMKSLKKLIAQKLSKTFMFHDRKDF